MQTVDADLDVAMAEKINSPCLGVVTEMDSSMSRSPRLGGLIVERSNFMGRVEDRGVQVFSKRLDGMEVPLRGFVKTMT